MRAVKRVTTGNRLLGLLPSKDRLHFIAGCDEVDLALSDVLFVPGESLRHVHFPMTAFVSLVAPIDASTRLEVGLVGAEGMTGTPLILGIAVSPLQALVQGAGTSLRMDAITFRRELAGSPVLKQLLDRYLFVRMTQLAQSAGCTRFHLVEARLARWLLMTQDRAHSSSFFVTHEFLALMLGVRRVGVTRAASSLHKRQLIRYSRGHMVILDRPGLEAASCACFKVDQETYRSILG